MSDAAARLTEMQLAVSLYLERARLKAEGGLTWAKFGELLVGLLRLGIRLAEVLAVPGPQKKEIVLEAAAVLFDTVADRAIPAILWPVWVLARPSVRSLVLSLASGAVEQLLDLIRSEAAQ
jgi:hypothetical protein